MTRHHLGDITLPEVSQPPALAAGGRLALTLLYHPDARRIGDRAILPVGGSTGLSRIQPEFESPRGAHLPMPLDDPYISREPIHFSAADSGLAVEASAAGTSLRINGELRSDRVVFDEQELSSGVVLCLAQRIVLFMHRFEASSPTDDDCGMVGESAAIESVRRMIGRAAQSQIPVLLLGETGTGKELAAQALHAGSDRAAQSLVALNMAALPPELSAAELFGAAKGAFTGAQSHREGYFSKADGGTLFLDEIGACDSRVQAQLLRALQQGEIQQAGGGVKKVDVRVLAATDADPEDSFSAALRYRMGGVEISMPPLRQRVEDIGRLLQHFIPSTLLASGADNPHQAGAWATLVTRLALYHWPGNVREFSNICEQIVLSSQGDALRLDCALQQRLTNRDKQPASSNASASGSRRTYSRRPPPSDHQIREAMVAARWEITQAAKQLDMTRQSLYRRIDAIPELRTASDLPVAEIQAAYVQCKGDLHETALRLQVSQAALKRRWSALESSWGVN